MGTGASTDGGLIFKECEELVRKGECTWDTLPPKMMHQMEDICIQLELAAEPPFPQEGDLQALFNFASLLADGKGLPRDEPRAVALWKKASERDHIPSRFMLGEMYYASRGISNVNTIAYYNEFRGVALWQSCSDAKFSPADRRLADAYRTGVGVVEKDEAKAVECYTRATNQCVAEAWSEIGELYEKGTGGFAKDESKAAQKYTFASDHGVASAQYNLGSMYVDGRGVEKDVEKGKGLWEQALESGLSNAQYHMAILYAHGANGFKRDPFKALGLLNHAAKQGHTKAQEQVEIIRSGGIAFKDESILPQTKKGKLKSKFMRGAAKAMSMAAHDTSAAAEEEEGGSAGRGGGGGDERPMSPSDATESSIRKRSSFDTPNTAQIRQSVARKSSEKLREEMGPENYSNMLRNKITQRRLASEAAVKLRENLMANQQAGAKAFSSLSMEEMRAAFDEVDTDGSGEIDVDELIAAMAKLDCPAVEKEAALEMIAGINGNDSGELTFEAFVKMMSA